MLIIILWNTNANNLKIIILKFCSSEYFKFLNVRINIKLLSIKTSRIVCIYLYKKENFNKFYKNAWWLW